jgi:hypothetical protein
MTATDTGQSTAKGPGHSTGQSNGLSASSGIKDTAVETAGAAMEQTKAVASEVKQHVSSLLDQTRGELHQQTEQRAQQLSSSLRTLSSQLRGLREGRPDEAGPLRHYLIDAEQKVSSWAQRLDAGGPQLVLQDVRSFARRKPGAFLVAAIGAGFVAGRLARAGTAAAHDQHSPEGDRPGSAAFGDRAIDAPGVGMADAPLASGTFA